MQEFYIYVYLNPNKPGQYIYGKFQFQYEPFYVGKGCGKRCDYHIYESLKIRKLNLQRNERVNQHKVNTILSIIDEGKHPIIQKLYSGITDDSAKRLERCIISIFGRKDLGTGPLSNLTEGGESVGSYWKGKKRKPFSEEHKKHISDALTGKKLSEETIEKIRNNGSWKEAIRKKQTGKKYSDEVNKKKARFGKEHPRAKLHRIICPSGEEIYILKSWRTYFNDNNIRCTKKFKIEDLGVYKDIKMNYSNIKLYGEID